MMRPRPKAPARPGSLSDHMHLQGLNHMIPLRGIALFLGIRITVFCDQEHPAAVIAPAELSLYWGASAGRQ